jgi:hypothetical protein
VLEEAGLFELLPWYRTLPITVTAVWNNYGLGLLENHDLGFEFRLGYRWLRLFCAMLFSLGRGFATGRSPIQGVLLNFWKASWFQKLIMKWNRLKGLMR